MVNREYILKKVKPYLVNNNILLGDDFKELFSALKRIHQVEVLKVLSEAKIEIDYNSEKISKINKEVVNSRKKIIDTSNINLKSITNEQLCSLYQLGKEFALELLINKNSKLVWSRVRKCSKIYKHSLDEEDLYQFGCMGLIRAVQKYNPNKEALFTTYSIWWIDQQIYRCIADQGFTIRIPVHMFEQVNRVRRLFINNPGLTINEVENIAISEGFTIEKFRQVYNIMINILNVSSLNVIIGEDGDCELGDFIVDDESTNIEDEVIFREIQEKIHMVLGTLNEREQKIIELRFGLLDGTPRTLEYIGDVYNVTRERIRQIEAKALRKLRHPSRAKHIRNFIKEN